jgi:hypothetical protein
MKPLLPLAGALVAGALAIALGRRAFTSAAGTALNTSRLMTLCALAATVALKLALGPLLRWWAVMLVFVMARLGLSLALGRRAAPRRPNGAAPQKALPPRPP